MKFNEPSLEYELVDAVALMLSGVIIYRPKVKREKKLPGIFGDQRCPCDKALVYSSQTAISCCFSELLPKKHFQQTFHAYTVQGTLLHRP